jgi:hypothetical protein
VTRADLEVVHSVGGTQGAGKSAVYYRYKLPEPTALRRRHLALGLVLRWLATTPRYTREVLLRGGRRQFVQRPSLALAAVHAPPQGVTLAGRALLARSVVGRRAAARRAASSQPMTEPAPPSGLRAAPSRGLGAVAARGAATTVSGQIARIGVQIASLAVLSGCSTRATTVSSRSCWPSSPWARCSATSACPPRRCRPSR